jgi:hypothetical protein
VVDLLLCHQPATAAWAARRMAPHLLCSGPNYPAVRDSLEVLRRWVVPLTQLRSRLAPAATRVHAHN